MSNAQTVVSTKVKHDEKEELKRIAYEMSSPTKDVSMSDVIRMAIRSYIRDSDGGTEFYDKSPNVSGPAQDSEQSVNEGQEGV